MHLLELLRHACDTRLSRIRLLRIRSLRAPTRSFIILTVLMLLWVALLLEIWRRRGGISGLLLRVSLGVALSRGVLILLLVIGSRHPRGVEVVLLCGVGSPSSSSGCARSRLLRHWISCNIWILRGVLMVHLQQCYKQAIFRQRESLFSPEGSF